MSIVKEFKENRLPKLIEKGFVEVWKDAYERSHEGIICTGKTIYYINRPVFSKGGSFSFYLEPTQEYHDLMNKLLNE